MFRYIPAMILSLLLFSATADAKALTYTIDPGTVGVISSGSGKVRLVIQPGRNCREVPYSVVADGVLASKGEFNLTSPLSMPLDYTVVKLSCSDKGVAAEVSQPKKDSLF